MKRGGFKVRSIRKIISTIVLNNSFYATAYAAAPSSGSGTSNDPYLITNAADLEWISSNNAFRL